jgi:ADYC domain-containing protein
MRILAVAVSSSLSVVAGCGADSPPACFQVPATGATYTGPVSDMPFQGTTLQGRPLPIMEQQGSQLQGINLQGMELQGMQLQGKSFGFLDLNGARLAVAQSAAPVSLVGGALVASGFADTAALRGVALTATTRSGDPFAVEVRGVRSVNGIDRIDIAIDGAAACAPGDDGLFVEGAWDERGNHSSPPGTLTYSCMTGVIAKCVTWGYAPWAVGADVHVTCTRLARADYCGDGNPWTVNGTSIGVVDTLGIQTLDRPSPGYSFEAAWGPGGALCVNDTRYTVIAADGSLVRPGCFASLPRCSSLDEASRSFGAVLANTSTHAPIEACP